MLLDEECKGCLYNSQMKKVESTQTDAFKLKEFKDGVKSLCENPPADYCAPLLMRDIDRLHRRIFGSGIDYSREKKLFNTKLSELEEEIFGRVMHAEDPLKCALSYASAANYIDFARLCTLGEDSVEYVIAAAERAETGGSAYTLFKQKLAASKTLLYLHDNCGEIVLDKILIRAIKALYPQIKVTSVVRGAPIINDVTLADASETSLTEFATVISNGAGVPGTYLKEVYAEVLNLLSSSDIIISKGLGNLETLYGEGYEVFYAFNCKCGHIAKRFGLELWSAAFIYEGK